MSERYVITGAQLGMFQTFAKMEDERGAEKLVNEIIDKQFLGHSKKKVTEDAKELARSFKDG